MSLLAGLSAESLWRRAYERTPREAIGDAEINRLMGLPASS
ncbi:hypothetical protein [Kitasatospora sp. NPDC004289]